MFQDFPFQTDHNDSMIGTKCISIRDHDKISSGQLARRFSGIIKKLLKVNQFKNEHAADSVSKLQNNSYSSRTP